jgi:hypothetical protein
MAGKGIWFTDDCIMRIVALLSTDLTIQLIAERMSCSCSAVRSVNSKFKVRNYVGRRSTWDHAESNFIQQDL